MERMEEDCQQSTSGASPAYQTSILQSNPESDPEKTPLEKAWDELVEKVSVAGWKEALSEKKPFNRALFVCTLTVFSICSFYYTGMTIEAYRKSGYKDEPSDWADLEVLQFSNVTICAQIYFNQTFIQSNLTVSPRLLAQYVNETNEKPEEFYRQLALFMTDLVRPRYFSKSLLHMFTIILRDNLQVRDFSNFAISASLPCEHILKRCWFNGVEFDCCGKAIESFDDDGKCYLLMVNFDSDNAVPSPKTIQQSRPGPAGGLSIEASVPLKDFPYFEDNAADNGYKVFINPVPYSAIQSPVAAPDKAETYIKVTPTMHKLATNCAPHGHMQMPGGEFGYYDPEGNNCVVKKLIDLAREILGCDTIIYSYRPNASVACGPAAIYVATQLISAPNMQEVLQVDAARNEQTAKYILALEGKLRNIASIKSRCPLHCAYWTYSSMASFSYLENDQPDKDTMYSRIHIYYGELEYRQYEQQPESSLYLLVCDLGNIVGLYWGMSVISFFHVLFYVLQYFFFWRRSRTAVAAKKVTVIRSVIINIKVSPADEDL